MSPTAFSYFECSLPEDMTISEYRRSRCADRPRRGHRMPRLLKRMT
jgi:hypothetical protein